MRVRIFLLLALAAGTGFGACEDACPIVAVIDPNFSDQLARCNACKAEAAVAEAAALAKQSWSAPTTFDATPLVSTGSDDTVFSLDASSSTSDWAAVSPSAGTDGLGASSASDWVGVASAPSEWKGWTAAPSAPILTPPQTTAPAQKVCAGFYPWPDPRNPPCN